MALREVLQRIFSEFPTSRAQPFAGHPLATFVRDNVPAAFKAAVPELGGALVDASPGKGNWVEGPWIAFFDPVVTETAQEGYYPVFLFTRSLGRVYLSLNQGVTELRRELGVATARAVLQSRAAIMAARLAGEFESRFSTDPIELEPSGAGSLLELYERGHALGAVYTREAVPADDAIAADVAEMMRLYRLLTARGGTADLAAEAGTADVLLEERRRFYLHRKVERNARLAQLAKKIHGYRCQVCGFEFEIRYGDLGRGYIEAHHRTPLAELPGDGSVRLSPEKDFAVVCANCHRMLHATGAPGFEEFKELYARRG